MFSQLRDFFQFFNSRQFFLVHNFLRFSVEETCFPSIESDLPVVFRSCGTDEFFNDCEITFSAFFGFVCHSETFKVEGYPLAFIADFRLRKSSFTNCESSFFGTIKIFEKKFSKNGFFVLPVWFPGLKRISWAIFWH